MPLALDLDMTELPPLRAVQVFEAIGNCGSVTAAAEALGITPSAVTQQIRLLERHLKVRLVCRGGRSIQLTDWGRVYLNRVAAGFEQLRTAGDEVDRARRSTHLAASALPSVATKWFGSLLCKWRENHPSGSVHLEGADAEPRLDEGEADFRISYGSRRRKHARYVDLFTDFVVPVGAPALLRGRAVPLQPREILSFPLLSVDWGPEHAAPPSWYDWLGLFGVSCEGLRCDVSFSLSSAALDAAIEGRGLVLAQDAMVRDALAAGRLVRLSDRYLPLPDSYFLAWSDSAIDKPLGAAFHTWVVSQARHLDRVHQ
jgi:LysR family transcriptional regulator, glycine cleavage system transcriptional activator